ncbi:FAD-binding protein [Arachnia propionica]|uniref:FAD-dependent oxidoreductase n=1 Tax=Arachnia propionica TaxID=1750 RepID=UPI001BA72A0A|nr:FAD-dependent oxidoreductase [Arachnia propionica]QUC14645.1 FAD-binding protein [Arachnia propionica]
MVLDVVVIGASVAGLTAARRLATEGFSVAVLDPNQAHATAAIGHGVAACAHASTVANMAGAYGDEAARGNTCAATWRVWRRSGGSRPPAHWS